MKNKPGFRGIPLMLLGVLLMSASVYLAVSNGEQEASAGAESVVLVEPLVEALVRRSEEIVPLSAVAEGAMPTPEAQEKMQEYITVEINGEVFAGLLEIPDLGLALPVYDECTNANLSKAPCRYSGAAAYENQVIAGHNYGTHFGELSRLSLGAPVYFTDGGGRVYTYRVADVETLLPSEVDEMTAGDYPLTLFTCTWGGKSRVTLRCELAE